jgi:plasmid stabilization system protein ParE
MARKVIWSDEAIADLAAAVRYIAADRPTVAEKFGVAIFEQTRKLADFPLIGRILPEKNDAAVREIIFDPYRIIYEVNPDGQTVDILRVWHGARGRPEV